jgi:general stress protein 26
LAQNWGAYGFSLNPPTIMQSEEIVPEMKPERATESLPKTADKTATATTHQEQAKKLFELIGEIKVAMLTTIDENESLRSRPMWTQVGDEEAYKQRTLWFFTSDDSGKAEEVAREQNVNLAYADPAQNSYVSVSGQASLVRDRALIEQFYNPSLKAWFPEGLDDPHIALLKVRVERAEFWDNTSNKMVELFYMAKSLLTGDPYSEGRNEQINFN